MRTTQRITAVILVSMLTASCAPQAEERPNRAQDSDESCAPQAEKQIPWPRSPDDLAVSLSVDEALEEGPVVCTVTLKNVSSSPLRYATAAGNDGAYCEPVGGWKARRKPLCRGFIVCGNLGPYEYTLAPGGTASETFYLHPPHRSITPGPAAVRFGWYVFQIVDKPGAQEGDRKQLDLLFELKGAQTVEVLAASAQNIASVLRRIRASFPVVVKSVEHEPDHVWPPVEAEAHFVGTIAGCRHQEFVPLLLQAQDQLHGADCERQLIKAVYESSPTANEGFDAFADYLSRPSPAAAIEVFDYWADEDGAHEDSKRRREELKKPLPPEPDPEKARLQQFLRKSEQSREDAWIDSKRHLDLRLTAGQFARLRSVNDVWVRALVYSYYPGQCPAAWVDALFDDLRRLVRPPELFRKLAADLDDDDFDVREQATEELIRSGPAFAGYLWGAPLDKTSPEGAARMRRVMERVEKPDLPPLHRRVISHLGWYPTPQNQRLLAALADGDCLISRAAQDAMEEAKKREIEDAERERKISKALDDLGAKK